MKTPYIVAIIIGIIVAVILLASSVNLIDIRL